MNRKTITVLSIFAIFACVFACRNDNGPTTSPPLVKADTTIFSAPDTSTIPHDDLGNMIRYGRDLVMNTAYYIGPDGVAGKYLGNRMTCTNCHLDGGIRPFGMNFFTSHARYPQYRGRENKVLSLGERINNCIERPHNGKPMPLDSREMIAIECYIKWIGKNTVVGEHIKGDELLEIKYPNRAASPERGSEIYAKQCMSCHGNNGEGLWKDSMTYTYPPLWGMRSYQKGSSPHRVTKLARFIKGNMPYKIASWRKPVLTDEECLDVAAFINDDRIHARPEKKNRSIPDYPNIKVKAIDYGTGPYEDTFSEMQHKFGPYQPIIDYHKSHNLPVIF